MAWVNVLVPRWVGAKSGPSWSTKRLAIKETCYFAGWDCKSPSEELVSWKVVSRLSSQVWAALRSRSMGSATLNSTCNGATVWRGPMLVPWKVSFLETLNKASLWMLLLLAEVYFDVGHWVHQRSTNHLPNQPKWPSPTCFPCLQHV